MNYHMRKTCFPLLKVPQYFKETIVISKEKTANIPLGGVFDTLIGGSLLTKQSEAATNTSGDVIVSPNSDIIVKAERMTATGIFLAKG
jgi:hypothetical protein